MLGTEVFDLLIDGFIEKQKGVGFYFNTFLREVVGYERRTRRWKLEDTKTLRGRMAVMFPVIANSLDELGRERMAGMFFKKLYHGVNGISVGKGFVDRSFGYLIDGKGMDLLGFC